MVSTISLSADGSSLVVETSDNGWAKCYLVADERTYLGADDIVSVLTRLRNAVDTQKSLDFKNGWKLEGLPVAWCLSLMEVHHVLYVADDGLGCVLFWQNARTSPVSIAGVMRLSSAQRQQWVQTLSEVLEEAKRPSLALA